MIKKLTIAVLVLTASGIFAQKSTLSPYSVFGLGNDASVKTVENNSMGGIGVALKQLNYINLTNPAANADIRYTTYALGGKSAFFNLKENKNTESGTATSLEYISLAFPISKKSGFSLGLKPETKVGYSLFYDESKDQENPQLNRFKGEGGLNKLFGSFGIYVFKGFSLGIEGGFVFGTIDKSIYHKNANAALATMHEASSSVRGFEAKLGAQYKTKLSDKLELSSGLSFELSNPLTIYKNEKMYTIGYDLRGEATQRTSLYNRSSKSKIETPLKSVFGFGVGKKEQWYVGFNTTLIKNKGGFESDEYKMTNGFKNSIGGFYIPKANSMRSYWDRVTYRAGIRYENTGLLVNVKSLESDNFTEINDFGINIGLGLPMPKQISSLNVGLEYGRKGTVNNNLVKENYINLSLSLNLNSLNWFKQRKID